MPTPKVIVHSVQVSQCNSNDWIRRFKARKLGPSMSRREDCCDDAVSESFFISPKKEHIQSRINQTRDLAMADIFDFIEMFYNRSRRQSHLGGVSPKGNPMGRESLARNAA